MYGISLHFLKESTYLVGSDGNAYAIFFYGKHCITGAMYRMWWVYVKICAQNRRWFIEWWWFTEWSITVYSINGNWWSYVILCVLELKKTTSPNPITLKRLTFPSKAWQRPIGAIATNVMEDSYVNLRSTITTWGGWEGGKIGVCMCDLSISKKGFDFFTYCTYLILFVSFPCHLDTRDYISFWLGLHNVK